MKHNKPTPLTNLLILLWAAFVSAVWIGVSYFFITLANIFQ